MNTENDNSSDIEYQDEDDWKTREETLADLTVLDVLGQGESEGDKARTNGKISVPTQPLMLPWELTNLAGEFRISKSAVQRLTLKHGQAIIGGDKRLVKLRSKLRELVTEARKTGDPDLYRRLDLESKVQTKNSSAKRTTYSTIYWVHGVIAKMAQECGLDVYQVAVACCLASVQTNPNTGGYNRLIEEGLGQFWDAVDRRILLL